MSGPTRPDIPAATKACGCGPLEPCKPHLGAGDLQDWEARARAAEAEAARLQAHVERLGREHARHALAVSVHKGRADQQESRAVRAEKRLARFASYAEEYDRLAEQAAESQRNADLATELRRRIKVLERGGGAAAELADLKRIHDREWHALWVMVRRAGGSVFIPEGQLSRVPSLASLGMALEPGGMRINASEEA